MSSFEAVLKEAGSFGRCQLRIFCIFCLVSVPFSFVYVGIVFQGFTPDHWCSGPDVGQVRATCGWTAAEARRVFVPLRNGSSGPEFSRCERVEFWNASDISCDSEPEPGQNWPTAPCTDGWEYDYEGRQSFVTEFDLVCERSWYVDLFQASLSVGFLLGSVAFGYLADKYGRMKTFLVTNFFISVTGILVATAPSVPALLAFRALFGFGVKGGWMVGYVLMTELVGVQHRRTVGVTYQMVFSLGLLVLPLLAFFITNWRWLQVVFTVPYICFLTYYWFIPESPRWLLSQNRRPEAVEIIRSIAKENKKTLSKNIETLKDESVDCPPSASFMDLFRTSRLRLYTFILSFNWFTSAVVYQGLIMRLGILGGNVYVDFLISGAVELPAALLILLSIERIGRRLPFATANILAGAACLSTAFIPDSVFWLKTAVACVGRLGITMAFEMVVFVNTELYPTVIRNLGVSVCSTLCDVGGIVAPFLLYRLAEIWLELPLIIFGCLAFVAGALVLLLPETKGVPLPETIADLERPHRTTEDAQKSPQLQNLLPDGTSSKEAAAV